MRMYFVRFIVAAVLLLISALGGTTTALAEDFIGSATYNPFAQKANDPNLEKLNDLRSALSIYYGEHGGVYPKYLVAIVTTGIIHEIPALEIGGMRSWHVTAYKGDVCGEADAPWNALNPEKLRNTGGWGYIADPSSTLCNGFLFIDSLAVGPNGKPWYRE